jgi:hypothetical protein
MLFSLCMTHQRHWLCTAAMVLMPGLSLSKYSFEPIQCCIYGPQDFFDIPDSEWSRFFEVNVMSGVRLSRVPSSN